MSNGGVRKKVFLGLWQVIFNRKPEHRNRPVQMLDIQRAINIRPSLVLNAVRALNRYGLIERVEDGYGWKPTKEVHEINGCWEHGHFNIYRRVDGKDFLWCPKCDDFVRGKEALL